MTCGESNDRHLSATSTDDRVIFLRDGRARALEQIDSCEMMSNTLRNVFMRAFALVFVAFIVCSAVRGAEVQLGMGSPRPSATATPAKPSGSPVANPQYRPVMLGGSPLSVINRINSQELLRKGQKDATLMFCCSVKSDGEVTHVWIYRQSPDSEALGDEVFRRFSESILIPAVYNYQPVHVLFFGTVTFKVVDGKPRLRIFANQEAAELEKESNFVGPQPFVGRESKFEGIHYPNDILSNWLSGIAELALKIDADGNLKDLRVASEHPPLAGFGRAAAEDFRVARFIPAFRDGKPVECNVTLPVYYEP